MISCDELRRILENMNELIPRTVGHLVDHMTIEVKPIDKLIVLLRSKEQTVGCIRVPQSGRHVIRNGTNQ